MKKVISLCLTLVMPFILMACTPTEVGKKEYSVTFELHNGQNPIVVQVEGNKLVERPVDPTRDGYDFDDWYKDEAGTELWVFAADRITANTTIHAVWTESTVEEAYNIDMWIESSYVNALRGMEKQESSSELARLVVAKNEYESLQVMLRSTLTFDVQSVVFSDLADQFGNAIEKSNLKFNFVEHQYFENNSPGVSNNDVIQSGAGYYPDALSNNETFNVIARRTLPIWVTLYVPKDTVAGKYTGRITINTNHGVKYVPMEIEVFDVTIPDGSSQDATYNNVFWQLIIGSGFGTVTAENHGNEVMKLIFGLDRWTEDWWYMVGEIAQVMKENRINTLYVQTVSLLVDGGSKKNADGTYTFDWSKFDEYIEFFIEKEVVNSFFGYMMMTGGDTYAITDVDGVPTAKRIPFDSLESDAWYEAYLPALEAHLEEKGWLENWSQALRDEPVMSGDQFRHYQELTEMVNRLAPDLRYGDPTQFAANSKHLLDIEADVLIPLIEVHSNNPSWYEDLNESQRVFTYTAVIPQGSWLNRFIDKPVYHGRHIGWYNFGHGASGYLHWGLMAWYRPITDFALGDTASIYPDIENNTIKSTIRLANLRDGAEDYELLNILSQTQPELANFLANEIASDAQTGYTKDINYMLEIREMLVKAASGHEIDFKMLEDVSISKGDLTLELGENTDISAILTPLNANFGTEIVWTSSNDDVAIIYNGIISSINEGTTTITASSKEFPHIKDEILVTVVSSADENNLVLRATDDSYLNENTKDSNHGTERAMYNSTVDSSLAGQPMVRRSVIKFDTTLINKNVESATLRLYFNTLGYPAAQKIGIYINQDHNWNENTITWNNAPEIGEKIAEIVLDNINPGSYYGIGRGINVEIDPSLFDFSGSFSITVILEEGDYATMYTKENANRAAQLFITLGEGLPITDIEVDDYNIGLPGNTLELKPVITPSINHGLVLYESTDESIATVDEFGVVTAISAGTVEIIVSNVDGSITASSFITVDPYIDVDSIDLNFDEVTLNFLEERQMIATVNPSNANRGLALEWSSSNNDIVLINQDGNLIAKNAGVATITVSSKLFPEVKTEIVVTVNELSHQTVIHATEDAIIYNDNHQRNNGDSGTVFTTYDHPRHRIVLKFDLPELDFTVANGFLRVYLKDVQYIGNNIQIQAYYPENEIAWSQNTVTWATSAATTTSLIRHTIPSSDLELNTWVDIPFQVKYERLYQSGQLTLTILANSSNRFEFLSTETGYGAMLILNHEREITDLAYLESEAEISQIGQTIQPTLLITPQINHEPVIFVSSDESIAAVNAKGLITAVGPGMAVITAKRADGEVSTFINVTVLDIEPVTEIEFVKDTLSLEIGENELLEVTFNEGANDGLELEWISSDTSILMVNQDGRVYAQNSGVATITVSSVKYPEILQTISVEVIGFENKVVFNVLDDAVIYNSEPSRNNNGNTIVSTYTQPRSRGVLKFNLSELDFVPTKAYLRVFLVRNTSSADNTWIQFHSAPEEKTWSEETITWSNTFGLKEAISSYRAPVTLTPNTWVDIPLNAAGLLRIQEAGQLSLTFLANGAGLFEFMSRETGQGAMLIIE